LGVRRWRHWRRSRSCCSLHSRLAAILLAGDRDTELLLFASTGPINATFINIVSPACARRRCRPDLFHHLLGDVPSPVLIGRSDASSLRRAVLVVPGRRSGVRIHLVAGRPGSNALSPL